MKQNQAVIKTIELLGGFATLGQLNQEVFKLTECSWKTKTPFASIRRIVQTDKSIYKIKPGLYGLISFKKENESKGILMDTKDNENSSEILEFNHSYFQGLLLTIGNLKGLETFIPNQDKNKMFLNTKLVNMRTLNKLPEYTYPKIVQRSSTIDVIWFNERKMPHSFFEVEHSTDIQNSLIKFNDLQDFNSRMIIVANHKRKIEFENKLSYSSFKNLKKFNRVSFMDYESLTKQYESILEQQKHEIIL